MALPYRYKPYQALGKAASGGENLSKKGLNFFFASGERAATRRCAALRASVRPLMHISRSSQVLSDGRPGPVFALL